MGGLGRANIKSKSALALALILAAAATSYIAAPRLFPDPLFTASLIFTAAVLSAALYVVILGILGLMPRTRAYKGLVTGLDRLYGGEFSFRMKRDPNLPEEVARSFNRLAENMEARLGALKEEVERGSLKEREAVRLHKQSALLEEELIRTNSDLFKKEVMLEEINQELISASHVKSEFISNMGRELKTPLNAIVGLADFINTENLGGLNERQKAYIENIKKSAANILHIVDNILEYTNLDMGASLSLDSVSAHAAAAEAIVSATGLAQSQGIRLSLNVPDVRLWVDPRKFRFILYDLISSAIKWSARGGRVGLSGYLMDGKGNDRTAAGPDGEATHIEFRLEFSGKDFISSDVQGLFMPFSRAASQKDEPSSGVGLSLSLVKKYVDLHDGKIWAENTGSGNRFVFILPLSVKGRMMEKKKLLLVEDDPEHLKMLTAFFKGEPYELIKASDGLEALRLVEEKSPDLILMDVLLPRLDGTEVCRALKSQEKFQRFRHIPVVLVTSLSDVGSKVRGIQAGADDFLVKPLDMNIIRERIKSLIEAKEDYEKILSSYRSAERDSATDPLTGLYNRRYMEEALEREFKNSERYGRNLTVMMADIDHFKEYNDGNGHMEGDRLLKKLAGIFKESVREVDTVARYGGEEFMIILPETPADMALVVAERMRKAVEASSQVTISIGLATYPEDSLSKEELIGKADEALYNSKRLGRNRTFKAGAS